MGKFSGVLLASDFDNTLIYTSAALLANVPVPSLSDENRKALEYFMAEGGKFTIATGRALVGFSKYASMVPMNAPGVVCNGAALYDFAKGEYLETAMLDGTALQRGQAILDRFPQVAVEAYHTDNVIHAVQPNEVTRQHLHITKVGITETSSLLEVPLPLGKLLFEADHDTLEAVRRYLAEQNWLGDYEIVYSTDFLLEMTAKGANKGGMVRRLSAFLGISMDHVYCAGDEANDISMLTVAAEGFAPANCAQAVRDCGATIVAHVQDNAIADIIERLDKRYS